MKTTWTNLRFLKVISLLLLVLLIAGSVSFAQKTGNKGGSGGGGGVSTPTPTPPPNPLPTTPPAPDILYRESFGEGPYYQRPSGGKGTMKSSFIWEKLGGFWIEYPGNKNTQWMNLGTEEGFRFCSNGNTLNPYELFSPLQVLYTGDINNGCIASGFDEPTGITPTALVPFSAPAIPYEISMDVSPSYFNGTYFSIGLTNSSILSNNLESTSSLSMIVFPETVIDPDTNATGIPYELRSGTTVLISGITGNDAYNRISIRVDPVQRTVGGTVNGSDIGTVSLDIGRPRYAGFEGIGMGDNFVIRRLQ